LLEVRRFDLRAPDMDDDEPNAVFASAYPLACCTAPEPLCRYLATLAPQPWQPFGVVPLCWGWETVDGLDGGIDTVLTEIDPPMIADWVWPEHPPSTYQPLPDHAEIVTALGTWLIPTTIRDEATSLARRLGYHKGVAHIVRYLETHPRTSQYGPTIRIRRGRIRVVPTIFADGVVELALDDFVRQVFAAPAEQLALF
jgi:hypothetical protein